MKPVLPARRPACVCTTVRRAARLVTNLYDGALAPAGLRITQYSVLATVDRQGEMAMTALADALGMDRTTLTRNLGPLERDGFVTLRAAGRGRTKLVGLSERGRRRLRSAFPLWKQAQRQLEAAAGVGAVRDLERFAGALGACPADPVEPA